MNGAPSESCDRTHLSPNALRNNASTACTSASRRDAASPRRHTYSRTGPTKHAAGRIEHREIPLSQDGLERLRDGMEIARDKGLQDALILMDGSAFIVSAKNSTVITAMNSQELKNKVITNIDGTVIL